MSPSIPRSSPAGRLGWVLLAVALALLAPIALRAAASVPPAPAAYFNDYAGFVSSGVARTLDARLAQFERDTSSQILVAIFPRLPAGAALEDYTVRTAQAWGAGRKGRDNGAVLFVFVADRALRIEVGYGLEGRLTDAISHAIIENELKPRLRAGRPAEALDAAVNAMIAASTGEYRGTGRTVADDKRGIAGGRPGGFNLVAVFWLGVALLILLSQFRRNHTYLNQNPRRRSRHDHTPWWGGGSGGGGGWSGGGGFSGGGGSFGGGGASGKW